MRLTVKLRRFVSSVSGIKQRVLSLSGTEHSSKKRKKTPQKTKPDWQTASHGSVPFQREDTQTNLYFDSYWQGVQLFVQFLENNELFQGEAAQPVEKREKKKGGN